MVRTPRGWRAEFLGRTVEMEARIDWRDSGASPSDQLWRMTLHYMEWLEALDDETVVETILDWIASNPPFQAERAGDAWTPYAVSIRTVVWMQQVALRAAAFEPDARRAIEESLATQIEFVAGRVETDVRGNHLIKNIKALLWGGATFDGPAAIGWTARGLRLLAAELPRQILADGVHYERSPSYHAQVFVDLLECRWVLGRDPLGGALDDALARMAQALADLTHPDGRTAQFNDAGLNMAYPPSACLAAYERLFGASPEPHAAFALPDAGYYGFRRGRSYLVVDCGPIGPDALVAHGHGDALSFEWSVDGRRLVVDPGVFQYASGPKRLAARSAASHNTLCFVEADQAEFFGAFRCGRRPRVEVLHHAAEPFVLEGTHDGFSRLPGRPRHVRRIEASALDLVLHDRIEGVADRPAVIGFLLHPDVAATAEGGGVVLVRGETRVQIHASQPLEIEPAVWWPDLGCELATTRLLIRLAPGECEVTTRFILV